MSGRPPSLPVRPKAQRDTGIITVLVGNPPKKYRLHRSVIDKIPYISQQIDSQETSEGHPLQFQLPDNHRPDAFDHVVDWIYDGVLTESLITASGPTDLFWTKLLIIYELAYYLEMFDLHNFLIDQIIRDAERLTLDGVGKTHGLKPASSPLYQLTLRNFVYYFMKMPPRPAEFKADLAASWVKHVSVMSEVLEAIRQYNVKPWGKVKWEERCRYHIHPNGIDCTNLSDTPGPEEIKITSAGGPGQR